MRKADLARRLEVTHSAVSQWERGVTMPDPKRTAELADVLGVSADWLLSGAVGAPPSVAAPTVFEGEADQTSLEGLGFVLISVYDAALSAGHGSINPPQIITDQKLAFRLDWLKGRTSTGLDRLGVLRVAGLSMAPDLLPGDSVLLDMSVNTVRRDGIYALSYRTDDEAMVKEVQRNGTTKLLRIISKNPTFNTYDGVKDEDVIIWGRVIWIGRNVD